MFKKFVAAHPAFQIVQKPSFQSDYLPEFLIKGDFPKLEWPDPEWKS
jgi:hypothetical protein